MCDQRENPTVIAVGLSAADFLLQKIAQIHKQVENDNQARCSSNIA
jgi:hypothetical protein